MLEGMETLIVRLGLLPRGTKVLCAVSGGADSICLLHRLYTLRPALGIELAAAHYNHTLRGEESERDQRFVAQFVALCCPPQPLPAPFGGGDTLPAVELAVGRGDVAGQAARTGRGLEETARAMRYAFLRKTAQKLGCDLIATAHNADDNAETLLLHLLRGSGLRGLGGIRPVRDGLVRPLLTTPRREIEDYLRFHGLPWVEDSTNRDDSYTRNKLRHTVTPALEAVCPGFARRLVDATALLREDEDFLDGLAQAALSRVERTAEGLSLPAADLAALPRPVAVRAARGLLALMRDGDDTCSFPHLDGLVRLAQSGRPSAQLHLPGGLLARREYENLLLCRRSEREPLPELSLPLPGETVWGEWDISVQPAVYEGQGQTGCAFYLSRETVPELTVRPRRTGDRLSPVGRPGKSLKKWFIDEKVPAARRDSLPVLIADGRVAAAAGLGIDGAFAPASGKPCWRVCLTRNATKEICL